jgi:hypothetical protein
VRIRHIARALIALAAGLHAAAIPPEGEAWRGLETPGFAITGNASDTELRSVAHNLESLRLVLSRIGNGAPTATEPTRVIVFKDASSFDPYRQGMAKNVKNVAGFFTEWMGDRFIAMNVAAGGLAVPDRLPRVPALTRPSTVRARASLVQRGHRRRLRDVRREGNKAIVGKRRPGARLHGRPSVEADRPTSSSWTTRRSARARRRRDSTFYAESWLLVHDLFFGHPQRLKQLACFSRAMRRVPHKEAFEKSFEGGIAGVEAESASTCADASRTSR